MTTMTAPDEQALILHTAQASTLTKEQKAQQAARFHDLINAAKLTQMTGYGRHGSIVGTIERVASHRLWCNPLTPATFTDQEKANAANALYLNGQQAPIKVVTLLDPDDEDAAEGRTADLM